MSPMLLTHAKRPVKLAAAFLAGALVVLLAKTALAGPLTSGIPTKFSVYQGVLSIVSSSTGVLELGANGTDIAGNSNLVLRPGTNNSAFVRADNSGGSDRATQLVLQGQTNQNLKFNLGVHTEASPAYADIGLVQEGVVWRNLVLAKNGGNVSIGGVTAPLAKLVVNNGTSGTGSASDAIAAYANGSGSAIYGEQADATGWAGYFSGKVNVAGDLYVTDAIYLKGIAKGSWPTQVCAVDGGACLGPWVGTKLMDDATKFNEQLCYFRQADPGPPAVTADIVCVNAFVNTPITYCSSGYSPITRSINGTSYFSDSCRGDFEYVLGGTPPYTWTGAASNVCVQNVPQSVDVSIQFDGTHNCSSVSLIKSFARIRNRVSVSDWHQVYELR